MTQECPAPCTSMDDRAPECECFTINTEGMYPRRQSDSPHPYKEPGHCCKATNSTWTFLHSLHRRREEKAGSYKQTYWDNTTPGMAGTSCPTPENAKHSLLSACLDQTVQLHMSLHQLQQSSCHSAASRQGADDKSEEFEDTKHESAPIPITCRRQSYL